MTGDDGSLTTLTWTTVVGRRRAYSRSRAGHQVVARRPRGGTTVGSRLQRLLVVPAAIAIALAVGGLRREAGSRGHTRRLPITPDETAPQRAS